MKIITKTGNLMHVKSGHIVHGCNAQGVMGSGVALAVKRTFPGAYESYYKEYTDNGLKLGYAYPFVVNPQLIVWNAITQAGFGGDVRNTSYDAIADCFENVNRWISTTELHTPAEIHIPLIGAARGGGNWEIIREIIEQTMTHPVTLWLPDATVNTL